MDPDYLERLCNHTRLAQLIARGEKYLHQIFKKRWLLLKNKEWEDDDGKELIKSCEAALPGVKNKLKNEKIDLWDVTAACHAIQAISKGVTTKAKEDKAIHALREARNNIFHGRSEYSNDEFNKKWSHIANILVKFGDNRKDIEELKKQLMELGKTTVEVISSNVEQKQVEEDDYDYITPDSGESDDDPPKMETEKQPVKEKSPNEQRDASVVNNKGEYNKLKDEANKYFKANEYTQAINVYTKILQLPGIIPEDKAVIFANRSVTHLSSKNDESLELAKEDAEWAIQLWPSWWRGYSRLARTQMKNHEWNDAEKSLNIALALNPSNKEVRDDLSDVRNKIGFISREEHLLIHEDLPSSEDMVNQSAEQLKISKKRARQYLTEFNNFPVIKGHRYIHQQDYENAAACYAKAANSGDIEGMYNFGKLLNDGKGVARNYDEAMRWLLKAATSGDKINKMLGSGVPEAQHLLGLKYAEGVGVNKDFKKAVEWYEKAFANGFSASANNLGVCYKSGQGVEKSMVKAFNYFKAAAELGDTNGMMNLAVCYFFADGTGSLSPTEDDINEGMNWLKRAAENGNLAAARELERRKDYNPINFVQDSIEKLLTPQMSTKYDPLDKEQHKKVIKEAAKKGSVTAQRLMDIWHNRDIAVEAYKNKDFAKVCTALAKAIRIDFQVVSIPEFLHAVIKEKMVTNFNEIDVVTCWLQLHIKTPLFPQVIDKYLTQFPEDKYLLEARISSYVVMEEINRALKVAKKALQLYPKSKRFLYIYAITLCMKDELAKECIPALDAFLAVAPKDHEKVPACHYRKSAYYFALEKIPSFLESFKAGLAAEKKQLPCFLPYFFLNKEIMEKLYTLENQKLQKKRTEIKNVGGSVPNSAFGGGRFEKIKENPQRKRLLLQHRKIFSQYAEKLATGYEPITHPPANKPQPPSLVSLKKITFKEMDLTQDKTYDGYVLEATIIDWAYTIKAIATVIEDENGDLQKFAIYNWPTKNIQILDFMDAAITFRPNVKISIINPYLRIANDAQSMIRVEGPAFVKLDDSSSDKRCVCCGKESKVLPCSQCLMSHYCSKDCQKLDWIEFNHKEICKHLKQFSQFLPILKT